jgi:transposase
MRIIEETLAPGAVVTEIARRHGIARSLVFTWRRRARLATAASAGPRLVPVQFTAATSESIRSIEAPAAMPARMRRGLIEIELGDSIQSWPAHNGLECPFLEHLRTAAMSDWSP